MMVTPAAVVSLVTRNLVPVIGVLLLGWSAANLLVLYYLDTMFALAVVVLLVAGHVTGLGKPGQRGRAIKSPFDWMRASLGALMAAVLICLPLGVPLVFVLADFNWSMSAALADRGFLMGLAMQVVGSVIGCVQAHRDLLARQDDERVLKHRAAFIVARWLVIVIAGTIGIFGLLGPWIGGTLLVLVYAGASVYFEMVPEGALRWLNPKEARADAARDAARPQ
jgi:Family of unknown function (DUF6498)